MEPETQASLAAFPENATKYEILGVAPNATPEDLRVAYRRLALLYHPDRHPEEDRKQAGEIFRRIASAWETLSDPEERGRYDSALSRKEEFKERSVGAPEVSLADILVGIDEYEHVFSEASVQAISRDLDTIVQNSLLGQLGEQVVDAWPLPSAPGGAKHRGSFTAGALVLTNIRVLLPFIYSWQETRGNVRTTYKEASMPVLPLPLLERIVVVSEKRVKRKIFVDFHRRDPNSAQKNEPRQTSASCQSVGRPRGRKTRRCTAGRVELGDSALEMVFGLVCCGCSWCGGSRLFRRRRNGQCA